MGKKKMPEPSHGKEPGKRPKNRTELAPGTVYKEMSPCLALQPAPFPVA